MSERVSECEAVTESLVEGAPLPPRLRAHAKGCAGCTELLGFDADLGKLARSDYAPMGPALREALADCEPVHRPSSPSRALPGVLAAAVSMVIGAALVGLRPGWNSPGVLLTVAMLAGVCALGFVVVFHRGAMGLGLPVPLRRGYPVLAAAAVLLASSGGGVVGGGVRDGATGATGVLASTSAGVRDGAVGLDPLATMGAGLSVGVMVAALMGAVLLRGARRTMPVAPTVGGLSVGATAGAVAAVVLALTTDASGAARVAAFGAPMAIALGVGALLGRRALAP